MRVLRFLFCRPWLACCRHGRCWTHSEWSDDRATPVTEMTMYSSTDTERDIPVYIDCEGLPGCQNEVLVPFGAWCATCWDKMHCQTCGGPISDRDTYPDGTCRYCGGVSGRAPQ